VAATGSEAVASPGTNGFAVGSLICGILAPCGVGILAPIFGILALVQIRKTRQRGKGLAIGGMAIFGLWLAAIGVMITIGLVNNASNASNDPATLTEADQALREYFDDIEESTLKIGDCVDDVAAATPSVVPCSEPHEGEVYAKVYLSRYDAWPGEAAVQAEAEKCAERLARISPAVHDDPHVSIYYLLPTELMWSLGFGDARAVDCLAYFEDGKRTGSLPR
jgi:hypothetical protein